MQFSAILGILLTILNNRKGITRAALAKKFEINPRTVTRYLDVIMAAGVPIESISGKNGGIRLPDTYKLDRSFFSKQELNRLSTCVKAMQSNFDDDMGVMLLDKINNMVLNKDDEKYLIKSNSLVIDTAAWANPQIFRNKIETVNRAIEEDLSLKVEYIDRRGDKSERLYDPYSLVLKEGAWYLFGWCHLRKDFRLLKLSRVRSLTISTKLFVKRPTNVYEKLNEAFEENDFVTMVIEFSSTVLSEIEEWLGLDSIIDSGTMYRAEATVYGGNVLIGKLLSFGSSVKVLEPKALREELLIECKRIFLNYD